MNSVTQVAETLQRIIGEEVEELAREVGFIQRERVLSGADFVQSLIFGWLQEPEITLDGLTQVLQRRQVSISASGLCQRFTPSGSDLVAAGAGAAECPADAGGAGGNWAAQAVQCGDPGG